MFFSHKVVPMNGLEPLLPQQEADFKSAVSTNSTTSAYKIHTNQLRKRINQISSFANSFITYHVIWVIYDIRRKIQLPKPNFVIHFITRFRENIISITRRIKVFLFDTPFFASSLFSSFKSSFVADHLSSFQVRQYIFIHYYPFY